MSMDLSMLSYQKQRIAQTSCHRGRHRDLAHWEPEGGPVPTDWGSPQPPAVGTASLDEALVTY